jgi:hypothetical protein
MLYLFVASCLLNALHASGSSSSYNYVTTIQASIPNIQDEFGSEFSLAVDGTSLILAASVPNILTDPHVEIFKSEDNGQTWTYSQSILCCPTSPSLYGFSTSFSENGTMLFIGNPNSNDNRQGGAMLYYYSNGQYVSSSHNLTCNAYDPTSIGESVLLSGDGKWAFFTFYNTSYQSTNVAYTNTQSGDCQVVNLNTYYDMEISVFATNFDGSTLIMNYVDSDQVSTMYIFTAFSYQSSTIQPTTLNFNEPTSISLTTDGSILAIGLCGYHVNIYNMSDLTSPSQIITPPPVSNSLPFGCNAVLSDDGTRLIVGSDDIHGDSYVYKSIGGLYQFDMVLFPPFTNGGVSGGGLAIVNTPGNTSVVLIGVPTSGILESGQIAVFNSVPSVTASPTASASGTSTPSSQPNDNIQPGANSPLLGITTGISITGGIIGSIIGYFLIRWIRKWYKSNRSNKNYTPYISIESINNETSSTGKESLITELYST